MTLPSLVQNYNKKILETAFKKSVNTVLNTNKMLLAQKEQFSLCDLEYFECKEGDSAIDVKDDYIDAYMKAFGFTKKKVNDLGMWEVYDEVYVSKDGACYHVFDNQTYVVSQKDRHTLWMFVDTNCEKRPNQGGRDQFYIFITDRADPLRWDENAAITPEYACKTLSASNVAEEKAYSMVYCGQYLIENSYNMDY